MPTGDHYFSATPESEPRLRELSVTLAGRAARLSTAGGIFSPDRIDTGTQVLLANTPPAPDSGDLLDLGCGWGPIALTLALGSPDATVWAVDVNERALDLVRRNARTLALDNVNAVRPEDVPDEVTFAAILSNPPIRVGKRQLHDLMTTWLPRLRADADAWLVVQRNLGSDSLHRWLQETLAAEFEATRFATGKGYRVLRVHRQA
jgi:16S rRNA (guanine1207-N2)-methyltransferase